MKLFIVLAAIALTNGAKLDKTYLPPSGVQTSGGSGNFLQTPVSGPSDYQGQNGFSQNGFARNGNASPQNGNDFSKNGNDYSQNENDFSQNGNDYSQNGFNNFEARPERAQAAFERNAAILRQDNQNDGETYSYAYETENGIYAEENGVATNGVEAQGGYSYTGDDGQVYTIRYTADQNGFVPQGDHLPTPPPVPEEILKALEQNARDEAAGIYDDGSYNDNKYGNGDQYNNNANLGNNYNNNNNAYNDQNEYSNEEDSVVVNSAAFRNTGANQGSANQGFNNNAANEGSNQGGSSVNKAYLPPFAQRRSDNVAFGSRNRQQSFSPRNGYQY